MRPERGTTGPGEREGTMGTTKRRALVTGASRGIGRGIALKLAQEGARVAIGYYRNEGAARETLALVQRSGSDGMLLQADVTRPDEVRRMVERAARELGGLEVFVSNARPELSEFYQPPLELTLERWDAALDSQAKAFLVAVQEAARLMPDGGRIVAVTYAPGGRTGSWQPWVAMGAAKAALESLCRYFAVALAPRGITVNAVSPGLTDDSVFNGLPRAVQQTARAWHEGGWTPRGRLGTPADAGHAVAFLCSEGAAWITGQTIAADGGASLMDTVFPLDIQRGEEAKS
jgi:NAD(P)-dependent dehydrogenase (short-subunit alcohol dehydrogenase family)